MFLWKRGNHVVVHENSLFLFLMPNIFLDYKPNIFLDYKPYKFVNPTMSSVCDRSMMETNACGFLPKRTVHL